MEVVYSKNKIPIRLTEERWFHIIESHDDLAGYYDAVLRTIEEPNCIIEGYGKVLIALQEIEKGKFLAVVYKEIDKRDGFVITAYFTKRVKLYKEVMLWESKS